MSHNVKECPFCLKRVAFKDDGVCPACGKSLAETGADSSKTLFTVSETSEIPPVCLQCGEKTNHRVTVEKDERSWGSGALGLIWAAGLYLLTFLFRRRSHPPDNKAAGQKHRHWRVRVSIPYCRDCEHKNGPPEPLRVNFEMGRMSFLVEKAVVDRLTVNVEIGDPVSGKQASNPAANPNSSKAGADAPKS